MARKAAKRKEGIGARVEALRNQEGMTQEDLADKIFVKREALKNKELGLRPFSLEEACRISQLFNVTLEYLVYGITTENVDIHKRFGLTDEGFEALETLNALDTGDRMEVYSHFFTHKEAMDALYEYLTFRPDREGYFLKRVADTKGPYITSMMSPELYEDQLETILMRVIRLAKYNKQPSWYYSSLEEYLISEGNEELKLAEASEFKGAKKSGKKK